MTDREPARRDASVLVWIFAGALVLALVAGPLVALVISSFSGPEGFTLANYRAAFG
jgi:ABC-type spermidine/putrescine transport system permease subunit II